ncbi:YbhN family protein [Ferrimicrobium sp.]|uniref:lysylphosphatidylglycerol synthase transmembrane domain-containing protein n=1 Tax=Ferrimicrobium sp. TaxID=2926050 RepID=UPI0026367AB1|nr:YbhN family protein [Ferrimicrobium sp.]
MKTATRHWVQITIGALALAVAAAVIYSERGQLSGTAAALSTANFGLIVVGFGLEVISDLSYALMTYYLLPTRLGRLTRRWFFGASLAAIAMNDSIPLGAGFSVAYLYRKLRGRGCSAVEATAALLAGNLLAIVALLVLLGFVLVAHTQATAVLSNVDIAILFGLLLLAVAAIVRMDRLLVLAIHVGARFRHIFRLKGQPNESSILTAKQLRYSPRAIAQSSLGALGNWLFDLATLMLSLVAVHAHVGLVGVTAAYVLGALAANLPITPGGLGVVEGSITVALVAFGGAPSSMLAAVLLYRVVSYWLWIPIGWGSYFLLGGLREK